MDLDRSGAASVAVGAALLLHLLQIQKVEVPLLLFAVATRCFLGNY